MLIHTIKHEALNIKRKSALFSFIRVFRVLKISIGELPYWRIVRIFAGTYLGKSFL